MPKPTAMGSCVWARIFAVIEPMVSDTFAFKAFLALFLIFSFQGAFAQEISLKEPFAPTPNAGAFGKYSDIPVSHFTGVPNISIPLYTVTDGGVSLPISLSYHSSGAV